MTSAFPNLAHIDTWVFDLDNTLYPACADIFGQIDVKMRQFIANFLNISLDEAYLLQKQYYVQHGTSLRGLMDLHQMAPKDFLDYVHQIDYSVLSPAPNLNKVLDRLPGRKIIFTNGTIAHSRNTLAQIGIAHHFKDIFDIEMAAYHPKPNINSYYKFNQTYDITPPTTIMFEDLHRNLKPAADLGMTTVWINEETHPDQAFLRHMPEDDLSHVHYITPNLTQWLEHIVV